MPAGSERLVTHLPFDQAPAAFEYLAEAGHIGKVVIER